MSVIKPKALLIEGFMCFGMSQIFHLPQEPGVWRIDGMNHVEPRLGSNGSGKTNLTNSLSWVRYGKTSDGQFGPAIKSWLRTKTNNMRTVVEEEGFKNGVPYIIRRSQDPNELSLDGRVVEQAELDEFLECDYKMFLATTLFPSNGLSFMTLGATEQSAKLADILKLESWADRASKANKKAKAVREQADAALATRNELEAKQEAHRVTIIEQQDLQREHDAAVAKQKQDDLAQIEALTGALVKAGKMPVLELETPAAERLAKAALDAQRAENAEKAAKFERSERQEELAGCQEQLKSFQEKPPATCYACGGAVDAQKYAEYAQEFESCVSEASLLLKQANMDFAEARSRVQAARELHATAQAEAEAEEQEQIEVRAAHEQAVAQWSAKRVKYQRTLQDINELKEKEYPEFNIRTLERSKKELEQDAKRIETLLENAESLEKTAARHAFWVEGFAKIRMTEMEKACAEFASYMLSAFEVLGLVGWQISVSCTQELASKETRAKFNIRIKSPSSPSWVDWKNWSGGQRHRLATAGDMAFADLASSRCGVCSLVEFWDERTNTLSREGCEDQMEYLNMRATSRGVSILAIDHRTGDSPVFNGLIWIDRYPSGSKISWKAPG